MQPSREEVRLATAEEEKTRRWGREKETLRGETSHFVAPAYAKTSSLMTSRRNENIIGDAAALMAW